MNSSGHRPVIVKRVVIGSKGGGDWLKRWVVIGSKGGWKLLVQNAQAGAFCNIFELHKATICH